MSARRLGHHDTDLTDKLLMPLNFRALLLFVMSCLFARTASAAADGDGMSRYFRTSDGVRLHYLEAGRGPTLVFVPGWTMPAEIWDAQIKYFSASYRVWALDPRGQGQSGVARYGYTAQRRARDIAELIDRAGEPVVLIGWSLGALESLKYVDIKGTKRLRALVLVDSSIGEEPRPKSDPSFVKGLKTDRAATTERFVRDMFRVTQDEAYLQRIIDGSLRMPSKAALSLLSYPFPREHWKQIVYRTDRPLLYAVGEHFSGQAENLKKNRPSAWVHVFENAGHALFVDEAASFNRLLEDFLAKEVALPGMAGGGDKKKD